MVLGIVILILYMCAVIVGMKLDPLLFQAADVHGGVLCRSIPVNSKRCKHKTRDDLVLSRVFSMIFKWLERGMKNEKNISVYDTMDTPICACFL